MKGPFAFPFAGTLPWLLMFKNNRKLDFKYFKKFGTIHGEYMGQTPLLVISNAKMAKQILMTDFHIFNQTQKLPVKMKFFENALTSLHGPKWKRLRSIVLPTFTSGKLRKTVQHFDLPMRNFFENLDNLVVKGEEDRTQIKELTQGYALDVIAKFVFAVQVNSFKQKDDPFVVNAFRITQMRLLPLFVIQIFPLFISQHFADTIFDDKARTYFERLIEQILKERRLNAEIKYKDFLELMQENSDQVSDQEIGKLLVRFYFEHVLILG